MTQPTLTVWCADPGCSAYLEEYVVPAFVWHDGHVECWFEDDAECPECGALRSVQR